MGALFVGTCGYSYEDWRGNDLFYPQTLKSKDYLNYYSTVFNSVEINFSYYQMPSVKVIGGMLEKSEGRVLFSVKAHKSITHEIKNYSEDIKLFLQGINPLIKAGCLGSILLQFPYSFKFNGENKALLIAMLKEFSGFPVVVEFRCDQWLKEEVFALLKSMGTGFCNVDEPSLNGLIPKTEFFTSDISYVRFHGRNRENWWTGDNTSRYDYLYTLEELTQWLPGIHLLMEKTARCFIFFNNHSKAKAVENALMLKSLLEKTTL